MLEVDEEFIKSPASNSSLSGVRLPINFLVYFCLRLIIKTPKDDNVFTRGFLLRLKMSFRKHFPLFWGRFLLLHLTGTFSKYVLTNGQKRLRD